MNDLAKRMKLYEQSYNFRIPDRLPVIIRLDGKCFHTFTSHMSRPFDTYFVDWMEHIALHLVQDIQGAVLAYVQSDEISILLWPWLKHESRPWFENELNKLLSVSASMATAYAYRYRHTLLGVEQGLPIFDSRVLVMNTDEVINYFIWRQQDWERNSLQMLAQSHYSHKELHGKKGPDMHEMLHAKGVNWTELPTHLKEGTVVHHHVIDGIFTRVKIEAAPRFVENRSFIEEKMNV